ncbi:MAG: hypothetical protein ACYCXY_12850 [Acidimicrobiales bacterium]
MAFFDEDNLLSEPEPEARHRSRRAIWSGEPDNVLPGPFGLELLVARSEQAFVAVSGAGACSTGFGLEVLAKLRQELPTRRGDHPRHWPPFLQVETFEDGGNSPSILRLRIEFSDGRVTGSLLRNQLPEGDPQTPRLTSQRGGGSNTRWAERCWVWPLPPPGPIRFICEWPEYGIRETSTVMDAEVIIEAASGAVEVWPEDVEE